MTMNAKYIYTTPQTEVLNLMRSVVLCASVNAVDGTNPLDFNGDKAGFEEAI